MFDRCVLQSCYNNNNTHTHEHARARTSCTYACQGDIHVRWRLHAHAEIALIIIEKHFFVELLLSVRKLDCCRLHVLLSTYFKSRLLVGIIPEGYNMFATFVLVSVLI